MREFIYISDRKLTQFMPDAPPPWWRRRPLRAEVKTPIGSVGFDTEDTSVEDVSTRRLYQATRHLEEHARWYEDPDLEAGEWVFFEARLGYQVIDEAELRRYSHYRRLGASSSSGNSEAQPMAVVFVSIDDP